MAVQNMYNNYLKRQNKNSTNQFRQKVANSLNGKTVNNNTTQNKTPSLMGNTLGNGVQNKPKARSVTQPTIQSPVMASNVSPITTNAITTLQPQSLAQSNITPSESNLTPEQIQQQQIQTQNNLQASNTTPQGTNLSPEQTQPQQTQVNDESTGLGMMSLSDIDQAINGEEQSLPENTNTYTQSDMQEIDKLANTPQVARIAKAKKKTAQEIAQDIFNAQKKQAQEEWEQQKKALELQKNQLNESYEISKTDAENIYKETEKTLQENRYDQQEDLAVSGQKRGIQYSPQQLALENVANINLNKNLADASNKRNELLNQLAIQLGQSLANVNMGLQNATVEYNKNVTDYMTNYQQQMGEWAYNDEQTQADRDFQKEMANTQNKWQAEQNALDRKQYSKSRSSGSYSYGSSYTPYSNSGSYSKSSARSYTPYGNDLDLSTNEGTEAYLGTVKQYSTDLYNALKSDPLYNVNERGQIYIDEMDKYIDYAKKNGASSEVINELQKTRQVATKHLFRDSYAKKTNSTIKKGDTYYKSTTPVKKEYVNKVKKNRISDASKYNSIVGKTNLERNASKNLAKTISGINKGTIKKTSTKSSSSTKSKVGSNRDFVYKPKTTSNKTSKTTSNNSIKKMVAKKTVSNKTVQASKKRTQTKFQKSFSNLKKNIANLFSRKKK